MSDTSPGDSCEINPSSSIPLPLDPDPISIELLILDSKRTFVLLADDRRTVDISFELGGLLIFNIIRTSTSPPLTFDTSLLVLHRKTSTQVFGRIT